MKLKRGGLRRGRPTGSFYGQAYGTDALPRRPVQASQFLFAFTSKPSKAAPRSVLAAKEGRLSELHPPHFRSRSPSRSRILLSPHQEPLTPEPLNPLIPKSKPPVHSKLCRLGEEVLHGVAGKVGGQHAVQAVGEGDVEPRGHLVSEADERLPRSHKVGLVEVALHLDVTGERADGHFLEHPTSSGTDERPPPAFQRVGKLHVHDQRHLQQIPLRIRGEGAIERGVGPGAAEGAIAADGVGVDRVVDAARLELESDPLVETVAGGEVEPETRVEGDRLIADCAREAAVLDQRVDVLLGVRAAVPGGDGHVRVDRAAEGEAQIKARLVRRF